MLTLAALSGFTLETDGELRYIGSFYPEFPVDAEGTGVGQDPVLDQRLRVAVDAKGELWSAGTAWDLASGQLVGGTWQIPGTVDARHREDLGVFDAGSFTPRRAAVDARLGPVQVQTGLVTSHWGLGMLANDGEHEPEFGRADFGDRVLRLRVATRPFGALPVTVALAGDRVVEDELARVDDAQAAWQGILAALWAPPSGNRLGLYGVYRDQLEPDAVRRTRVGVADVYGELVLPIGAGKFHAGAEAAGVTGRTSRASSYATPDGLDVRSAGATGFVGVATAEDRWGARVRSGWASGDGDPDDGTSSDFSFDRDLDAGMLLFDEYGGAIEAGTYALLSDTEHSGGAPDGADTVVTEGSFRRAVFVQPVLEAKPAPWLGVRVGVLAAWSTAPIAQPYYSFRNGGVPTNHLDVETEGNALGTELDWAVRLGGVETGPGDLRFRPELLVQGAHLRASADHGNPDGGILTLVTATARARW